MSIEIATLVTAIVSALTNVALVVVGYRQLRSIAHQIELQGWRERKTQTLTALENYIRDSQVNDISKRIWEKSKGGVDYCDFIGIDHDAILALNYLEGFATAILQGAYDEQMVRDFLEPMIFKMVSVFIRGESGSYMGASWKAQHRMFSDAEYQNLVAIYHRWWPPVPATKFRDRDAATDAGRIG